MKYSESAKLVFDTEIKCLSNLSKTIGENFDEFVYDLDCCKGLLIWMGIGKSGHICNKIVATLQSLGIKSMYVHPSEALHGDLGVISSGDIVVMVSNSGETKELLDTINPIKNLGARIYGIIGRCNSSLEKESEKTLIFGDEEEAFLGIVPTSSTTATLVLGDAIAIAIAKKRGVTKEDFGKYHPNGQLGKRLTLRVSDVMIGGSDNSVVLEGSGSVEFA